MARPNVVVFFTDQQRWDSTGVHGNPLGLTPNFDQYTRTGTLLSHHFTCQPVCGPARSCLQTGLYAMQTGSYRNGIPLRHDLPTLAKSFTEAGYATGYIGKWHLGSPDHHDVKPEDRGGYDYWLAANDLEMVSDAYKTLLYDKDGQEVRPPGYRVDALTDAAIRFIDARKEDPFFLFVSYLEPHHENFRDDYPAPTGYEELYRSRPWTPTDLAALGGTSPQHLPGYWGMVKRLDEAFGRMMDSLRSLGLLDNTIVLFTSDHGCHFKTRNSEYKRSCHDSSLRVPTLLHGPGFEGGRHFLPLTSLVDLPPTLLDAAGVEGIAGAAGKSLMPELKGAHRADEDNFIFAQISEDTNGRTIRTSRWKYCISAPWNHDVLPTAYTESHLYDLLADPYELNNLIGVSTFDEITTQLRAKLLKKMAEIGEPTPQIDLAPQKPAGQRRPEQP